MKNYFNTKSISEFLVVLVALLAIDVTAGPITNPYLVPAYAAGNQHSPHVLMDSSGDHAVIFYDNRGGQFIRSYNADGSALYSTELPAGGSFLSTSMAGNGNYVGIKPMNDGSNDGVYATVFNKQGSIIVNSFRVNNLITGPQVDGVVAMNRNGEFVVAWSDWNLAGSPGVYVKRFNAYGVPTTPEILVRAQETDITLASMDVAIDESGGFAVVYQDHNQLSSYNIMDVWVRRYNEYGVAANVATRANSTIAGLQDGGSIAMDAFGNYLVIWDSNTSTPSDHGVYGQRFNANGYKVGTQFKVNTDLVNFNRFSSVSMAANGSAVVSWLQFDLAINHGVVVAREFDEYGVARGNEFQVNANVDESVFNTDVKMDACGNYIVSWDEFDANQSSNVYARRYASANPSAATCIANGKTLTNLTGVQGSWQYYKITVPAGKSLLDIQQVGPSTGDADLYIRYGALPTLGLWDQRPYVWGNTERVVINSPVAGDWYIGINAYESFSSVLINAQHY